MVSNFTLWVFLCGIEDLLGFGAGIHQLNEHGEFGLVSDAVVGEDIKLLIKSYTAEEDLDDETFSDAPVRSLDGMLAGDAGSSVFYNYVEGHWQFSFLNAIPGSYLPFVVGARLTFEISSEAQKQFRHNFKPDFDCVLSISPSGSISVVGDLHSIKMVWESDEFVNNVLADDLAAVLDYWNGVLAVFQTAPQ